MQTRLDLRMIEDSVFLATSHKDKACQIREHGSSPILAIEPEQRARRVELIHSEIARDRCQSLTQFLPISPIASVSETAQPLVAVRLTNGCACADDLPRLRPR